MKITVKTLDSRTGEFDLSGETTIRQLKDMIVEKLSIPLDRQRLLFHGKPLKDDRTLTEYGIGDGEVIRLVSTAPPTAPPTAEEQTTEQEASQSSPQDMDTSQPTQDVTPSDTAAEAPPTSKPPPSEQPTSATAPPPEPVVHRGPTLFKGSSPFPPLSATFDRPTPQQRHLDMQERWREQERRMHDRTRRQAIDVYSHVKSTRKCLKFAKKVLDRYFQAEALRAARKKAKEEEQAKEAKEEGQTEGPKEEGKTEEPKEEGKTEELKEEGQAEEPKEEGQAEEQGQAEEPMDTSSEQQEPKKEEYVDTVNLADENAELPQIESEMFASILEEMQELHARARPLIDEYEKLVREESTLEDEESLHAQRISITVKDFNYYMGHACASSSRLQIAMHMNPPRFVKIVPPRRNEMRRVLHQLQSEAQDEATQEKAAAAEAEAKSVAET